MSLAQPNGVAGRTGPRGRKALALFVTLVLSGFALVLAAGEALAQQQSPAPKAYAAATTPERTPVSGTDRFAESTPQAPPADSSSPQAGESDAAPPNQPEPAIPDEPEPALTLPEEFEPMSWIGLAPEAAMPEDFGGVFEPDPALTPAMALPDSGPAPVSWESALLVDLPPLAVPAGFGFAPPYPGLAPESVSGPVAFQENRPLLPHSGEKAPLLAPPGIPDGVPADAPAGVRAGPHQVNKPGNALPGAPAPSAVDRRAPGSVLQNPPTPGPAVSESSREAALLLSELEAAASGTAEALHGAAVDVSAALSSEGEAPVEPSPGGTEKSSEEAPPPPSPAPLGGSAFSLLGGGQIGPGGVVPLLICVLVAGVILLRPAGRLSWASCELPKPSPVLLLPLERPG